MPSERTGEEMREKDRRSGGGACSWTKHINSSNVVLFLEHSSAPSASRGAEEHIQEVEEPLRVPSVEEGRIQQCVQPRVEVWEVPW